MKGFTHFIVGAAVATFFSEAVLAAEMYDSFIIVLGGVFGIMPDWLDFKMARYLEENDVEIDPSIDTLDPQLIADSIARLIDLAVEEKRMTKIQLHTIKLSYETFQQYSIHFDTDENNVIIKIGPVVSMGQVPYPGTEPPPGEGIGIAKTKNQILHTHSRPSTADIFSGPQFGFLPTKDGVRIEFIPFHRKWSHSLTLAALMGLFVYFVIGFYENYSIIDLILIKESAISPVLSIPITAGLIAFFAAGAHVAVDQMGFMGNNLFWPFTKDRSRGLRISKASSPLGNFTVVWLSGVFIFWNLNYYAQKPSFVIKQLAIEGIPDINFTIPVLEFLVMLHPLSTGTVFFILAFAFPMGVVHIISRMHKIYREGLDAAEGIFPEEEDIEVIKMEEIRYEEEEFFDG